MKINSIKFNSKTLFVLLIISSVILCGATQNDNQKNKINEKKNLLIISQAKLGEVGEFKKLKNVNHFNVPISFNQNEVQNKFQNQTIYDMPIYDIPIDIDIQKYIYEICNELDIEYELVLGLFQLESRFDNDLVCQNLNGTKDVGIGQLNNKYSEWYGELAGIQNFDINNIRHNIKASLYGLDFYIEYWNDKDIESDNVIVYGLNSYNMGIGGYNKYLKTGKTHRAYDKVILENRDRFTDRSEVKESKN